MMRGLATDADHHRGPHFRTPREAAVKLSARLSAGNLPDKDGGRCLTPPARRGQSVRDPARIADLRAEIAS